MNFTCGSNCIYESCHLFKSRASTLFESKLLMTARTSWTYCALHTYVTTWSNARSVTFVMEVAVPKAYYANQDATSSLR